MVRFGQLNMTAMPIGNVNKTNISEVKVHSGEGNRTQTSAVTTAKYERNEKKHRRTV